MRKIRKQFRLFDIYRMLQDGYTDKIAHIKAMEMTVGGTLSIAFATKRNELYNIQFYNVDTLAMRKAAVRQINKSIKEASTRE